LAKGLALSHFRGIGRAEGGAKRGTPDGAQRSEHRRGCASDRTPRPLLLLVVGAAGEDAARLRAVGGLTRPAFSIASIIRAARL